MCIRKRNIFFIINLNAMIFVLLSVDLIIDR